VDVGTNTVLFLAMENTGPGRARVLGEGIAPTRLGAGLAAGEPSAAARAKTLDALEGFLQNARDLGVENVRVVGTEVLRRGAWRREFLDAVRARFGLGVEVLTPEEEGRLVLLAARRSLPLGFKPVVAVDVGGGSAQVIRELARGRPPRVASYPVGCVLITERFFQGPGEARAWDEARAYINKETAAVEPMAAAGMVLAGGTAATLAALELGLVVYDAAKIHGFELTREACFGWAERVYALSPGERALLPGMPEGRADVFPAGALAVAAIMEKLGRAHALVSAQGVRYGVAYRYFDDEATA